jgi:hypothetical protein
MALPSSGEISASSIRSEFQQTGRAPYNFSFQMDPTWAHGSNDGYTPVNQKSTTIPSATDPDNMSEWYSYNHSENWPCGGSGGLGGPVSMDVSNCRRKFFRVSLSGASGYTADISVYGDANSSIFSYRIYDVYPFTSTGAFVATSPVFSGNMSTTTTTHTYTMSASSVVIYAVVYENDCA